ncbi:CAP domain-containing protein [Conexibacter sp. SYSU D00693]|uniref:CAP domain-containing protein n=1 Tax=Conexibacter sp. SYSU D00693 TaxID=2812560 RepID=UPI00196AF8C3|nr:CAP domain-containing protein [Conexibacter sp. SYSU D00693]
MRLTLPPLATLTAVAALALPGTAAAASCPNADVLPGTPAFSANAPDATLCLINERRAANGVGPVSRGPAELEQPARLYAVEMVLKRFFSHTGIDGSSLFDRLKGYTTTPAWQVGENLAWGEGSTGSPAQVVQAWMDSPGHRANLLNGVFTEVGIGIADGAPSLVSGAAATYVTEYGTRSGAAPAPTPRNDVAGQERQSTPTTTSRPATTSTKAPKAKRSSTKRTCRTVVKRVNGKKRKVRRCAVAKKAAKRSSARR